MGGFLSELKDSLTGRSQQRANDQAVAEMIAAENRNRELFEPALGLQNFDALNAGASVAGFGDNINNILGSGMLDGLLAKRRQEAEAAMTGAGLRRSSFALDKAAELPAELAFAVEQTLRDRQLQNNQIGMGAAHNIAGINSNIGDISGQGILANNAARSAGIGNIIGLGAQLLPGAGKLIGGLFNRKPPQDTFIGGIQDPNAFMGLS